MVYKKIRRCCVPHCKTVSSQGITLFNLPQDEPRRNEWLKRTGADLNYYMHPTVCSLHFDVCYFTNWKRNRMENTAVPTLYLTAPPIADKNNESLQTEVSGKTESANGAISESVPNYTVAPETVPPTNASNSQNDAEKVPITLAKLLKDEKRKDDNDADLQIIGTNDQSRSNDLNIVAISPAGGACNKSQDASIQKRKKILTKKNIGTICRICLGEKDVLNLNETRHEKHTYAELLEMCSTIKLQEDPILSQNICQDCSGELLQAYKFRRKCSRAQETLNKFKNLLEELLRKEELQKCLMLRFHDYNQTLNEVDVRNYVESNCKYVKQRMKADLDKKKKKKVDRGDTKTVLNDSSSKSDDVEDKVATLEDVSQNSILRSLLIRNMNKRKMLRDTRRLQPNGRSYIENVGPSRKRKKPAQKPGEPPEKTLVIPGVCELCQEPYNTVEEYRKHANATKHYLNRHVCKECGKIFPNKSRLAEHWGTHYANVTQQSQQICDRCGKCCKTRSSLISHMKTHSKTDYVCKHCGSTFDTLRDVISHSKLTHRSEKKNHCCEYCGQVFTMATTLRQHMDQRHLKLKRQFCQICGKGYLYKCRLKKHLVTHSSLRYDCKFCNNSFKVKHGLTQHMKVQHPGIDENTKEEDEIQLIKCDYCDTVCRNKQQYSVHLRDEHEANTCIYCDLLFEKGDYLDEHTKEAHTDIPDYTCRYCGKCFEEMQKLYVHSYKHKAREIQCSFCFKRFLNTTRLKMHIVMHTGEKLHKCQYCDKAFLYNTSRNFHERLHTGIKPYVCDICDKRFACGTQYKNHMQMHARPPPMPRNSQELHPGGTKNALPVK